MKARINPRIEARHEHTKDNKPIIVPAERSGGGAAFGTTRMPPTRDTGIMMMIAASRANSTRDMKPTIIPPATPLIILRPFVPWAKRRSLLGFLIVLRFLPTLFSSVAWLKCATISTVAIAAIDSAANANQKATSRSTTRVLLLKEKIGRRVSTNSHLLPVPVTVAYYNSPRSGSHNDIVAAGVINHVQRS